MKTIVFLTNSVSNLNTAGGILYKQIRESITNNTIVNIGVSNYGKNINIPNLDTQFSLRIPNYNFVFKVLRKLPLIEPIYILIRYLFIKKKVIKEIEKKSPEKILFQLRGESLLFINSILDNFKTPIYGIIEDTVEREIDEHFSLYLIKKHLYYKAIPKMNKIGVAGETMQKYIIDKFNKEAIIIRPWYVNNVYKENHLKSKEINIFFGGNIYAPKAFYSFLRALDIYTVKNPDVKINMIISSNRKIKFISKKVNILQSGWVNSEILELYMKKSNYAYLPYIFNKKQKHSMSYAFPGKAGLYIANNLPIIFHGPSYSSFNLFLKKYKVGVSFNTLNKNYLAEELEKLFNDVESFESFSKDCKIAYFKEYSEQIFNNQVQKLLDL